MNWLLELYCSKDLLEDLHIVAFAHKHAGVLNVFPMHVYETCGVHLMQTGWLGLRLILRNRIWILRTFQRT